MNADLFIKVVLFLHRYLTTCSDEQLRDVRHAIYHKMLTVSKDPFQHMYEWCQSYRSRCNGYFLPRLSVNYIVHLLVVVDKFYMSSDWDAIDQASQKLSTMLINNKSEYDKYAEFFKAYTDGYYGDGFRRRCLLRNSLEED